MSTYFNYNDLSITMKPTGDIVFNKELIYRKMSKYFVMPQWIESDVDKILNDNVFNGITDTETIQKIINSKILELNNVLVPIARANNLKNSAISHYINFENYFIPDDVVLVSPGFTPKDNNFMDKLIIDVERVFQKLSLKGFNLEDDEKDKLVDILNEELVGMETKYSFWNIIKQDRLEKMIDEIKMNLAKRINEYLLDNSTPMILRYMLDNVAVDPYFRYNNTTREIEFDDERVFYLLDAMGYHVFGSEDRVRIYLLMHTGEVEKEINQTDFSDVSEDSINNLTLYVNLSILNRIKFVSDNGIPFDLAFDLRYPEVVTSQLELEAVYIDRCAEMLSYDNILDDLAKSTGIPKYKIDKHVDSVLEESKNTFKLLKDSNASVEVMYRGVMEAYTDMINRAVNKINREFHTITSYNSTTTYGSGVMNNLFHS